ncbi:hypothetical protein [Rivularia sp. UHCC 0363]|uniref:hypothetical protein n=1 Tax=Rivularia sp. UHCC 0363 TaxID=3110244 RepID=UPI002B220F73|nr:hypothetical protein [Rivularia sp. UHCC 0363]MEA5597986.1 hypothetical protein [Rivularia sp. UHCC 0363]
MVAVVSTQEQLKEALMNKIEEIVVIDAELATDIGKFIERLSFENDREYNNIVTIASVGLIIGFTLLTNLMAFGFLIVGIKVLIVPEIILFIGFLIALAKKLNNLLKNNYEIVKEDEEGLFLRYKLS